MSEPTFEEVIASLDDVEEPRGEPMRFLLDVQRQSRSKRDAMNDAWSIVKSEATRREADMVHASTRIHPTRDGGYVVRVLATIERSP